MPKFTDRLPRDYDYVTYVGHPTNADIASFDAERALRHYKQFGIAEGRICSKVASRKDFLKIVPDEGAILEIGPFFRPDFVRPASNVRYLDCLSTQDLVERGKSIKEAKPENIPEIDYVWTGQPYAELIESPFQVIYSAHNLEHQPCLITHLRDIESVLEPEGAVFLALPDKRYCFDHFFAESTLVDIVDAWSVGRQRHSLANILEHRFFTAHNDPVRHWQGDHGPNRCGAPLGKESHAAFLAEVEKFRHNGGYSDVHAWKFTPTSFRVLMEDLYRTQFTNLRIARLYPTVKNSNEFYCVLTLEKDR